MATASISGYVSTASEEKVRAGRHWIRKRLSIRTAVRTPRGPE